MGKCAGLLCTQKVGRTDQLGVGWDAHLGARRVDLVVHVPNSGPARRPQPMTDPVEFSP